MPLSVSVCAASVRTGQVIRCEDVNTEVLFDPEPVRQRGVLSLLAVPIYHDGDIVGALELYFDLVRGYAESDIHTCQLMAGLVTEAIGRDAESKLKRTMAAERSSMLAAIEKLQPNLAALAHDQASATLKAGDAIENIAVYPPCWKCGNKIVASEQYCGKCGSPRARDGDTSDLQSKVATAWHMQHPPHENAASINKNDTSPFQETPRPMEVAPPPRGVRNSRSQELGPRAEEDIITELLESKMHPNAGPEENRAGEAAATSLVAQPEKEVVWSSAAKARDFLESVSGTRAPNSLERFWNARRGDFYLAIAVILVIIVIRWGIWSSSPVGATNRGTPISGGASRRKSPMPDSDLSTLDKLLVGLGLAEAPAPAEYKGNPDTQVWIDLQTALYYCPGSDLYSKTTKGRLASQRDAQLDQFEPANRRPCD